MRVSARIKAQNGKERQAILPCATNMPPPPAGLTVGGLTASVASRKRCRRRHCSSGQQDCRARRDEDLHVRSVIAAAAPRMRGRRRHRRAADPPTLDFGRRLLFGAAKKISRSLDAMIHSLRLLHIPPPTSTKAPRRN